MRTLIIAVAIAVLTACSGSRREGKADGTTSVCSSAEGCKKSCNGGKMPACTHLATLKLLARDAGKDNNDAVALLDKACNGGHARACLNLMNLLYTGSIVPKDEDRGRRALQRACELQHAKACADIVLLDSRTPGALLFGKVAPGFAKLCERDNVHACASRASTLRHLVQESAEQEQAARKASQRAYDLANAQCEQANSAACYELAVMLLLWKDQTWELVPAKSIQLMQEACERGHSEACVTAAFHLARGEVVPKDLDKAKRLAMRACRVLDDLEGCAELFPYYPWQQ